jgi:mannose-6-phosphate isomerase-like protein (cupin superfamily)
MPRLISQPTIVNAVGNMPKRIEEYVGRINSSHSEVSIAKMVSPAGWIEPGQRPGFQEITLVLKGRLKVEHESGEIEVQAGQAVVAEAGEWVRYSSPYEGGAEYGAVCLPAFSPSMAHRDK